MRLTLGLRAECVTAMRVSVRDELSLSISVAVGSTIVSLSIDLIQRHTETPCLANRTICDPVCSLWDLMMLELIFPRFMVLLAWVVNKPLTLLMDPFQSLVRVHVNRAYSRF
jgi:Ca2+:H+ antiporter